MASSSRSGTVTPSVRPPEYVFSKLLSRLDFGQEGSRGSRGVKRVQVQTGGVKFGLSKGGQDTVRSDKVS